MNGRFQSLRFRLLLPLIAAALAVALVVAVSSYRLGARVVETRVDERFAAISATLDRPSYPLTAPVVEMLSGLTGTELVTYRRDGRVLHSTVPDRNVPRTEAVRESLRRAGQSISDFGTEDAEAVPGYLARSFARAPIPGADDSVSHVLVLFDEQELQHLRWQAASLPLITGLSTMFVLSVTAWTLTRPLIRRIAGLQVAVERIAAGEFNAVSSTADSSPESGGDELTRLGRAVRAMGRELGTLWDAVHQQERQKLIHQLAAGLAHQLRNSLTGARMAVELHARRCSENASGGLEIALGELERTEGFVQRILLVASDGPRQEDVSGTVIEAIDGVRGGLTTIAKHQRIDLNWTVSDEVVARRIADVYTLSAALQNLVLNALQSGGNRVGVTADCLDHELEIIVRDNGPGSPELPGADIFDAFVTSKPEGLGLGLTLVRRAAERLGGGIAWRREDAETVFRFVAALTD